MSAVWHGRSLPRIRNCGQPVRSWGQGLETAEVAFRCRDEKHCSSFLKALTLVSISSGSQWMGVMLPQLPRVSPGSGDRAAPRGWVVFRLWFFYPAGWNAVRPSNTQGRVCRYPMTSVTECCLDLWIPREACLAPWGPLQMITKNSARRARDSKMSRRIKVQINH